MSGWLLGGLGLLLAFVGAVLGYIKGARDGTANAADEAQKQAAAAAQEAERKRDEALARGASEAEAEELLERSRR